MTPPDDVAAPVRRTVEQALDVASNAPVVGEYRRLVLAAPADMLATCRPGQFFHLLCPATGVDRPYLRRPMSIYGAEPQTAELQFLYKVVGAGGRGLAGLSQGDALDVLGPLGQGFTIPPKARHLVVVARGVGLATLAPLAEEAARLGRRMTAICSARHPDLLMSADRFEAAGATVIQVTDAAGTAAAEKVGSLVEDLIANHGADALYTCGSARLLALLQDIGRRHGIQGQVAMEQQMACGLGMCHCCVRPFRQGDAHVNLRVCREGPVFDLQRAVA